MRFGTGFVYLVLALSCSEACLAVEEERLGAWHYLRPMEYYQSGSAKWGRPVSAPTAVGFGERLAVLMPGSMKVAEFRDGRFEDLDLPTGWGPLSLAVDRAGKLY